MSVCESSRQFFAHVCRTSLLNDIIFVNELPTCAETQLFPCIKSSRVKIGTSSDCLHFLPIIGSLRSSKCQRNGSDRKLEI